MRILAVGAALLLVGCASPPTVTRTSCLPMVEYTREQQNRAADEIQAAPSSQLATFAIDYGTMRAANRACLATKR